MDLHQEANNLLGEISIYNDGIKLAIHAKRQNQIIFEHLADDKISDDFINVNRVKIKNLKKRYNNVFIQLMASKEKI